MTTLEQIKSDVFCVTMYGGPKHGRKFEVPRTVGFLNDEGGHYARVEGGLYTAMYWHNFKRPIAVRSGGILWPVMPYEGSKTADF